MVVKSQYLCSMKVDTNSYWNQQPKNYVITVPIRTILYLQPEVNSVAHFHAIPTRVYTRTQENKFISRHPICLTDSDFDYVLEEIGHRDIIEFERYVEVFSSDEEN